MNKRSMRILGFYQVQNMLVRLAPSRLSKEIARRLRPVNDSEVIERNLTDTEEAVRCMQTETSTPFGGIVDIRPSLEKAKREVTLDSHECIDIWNNLQHYGEIRSFFADRGAEYPQLAEQADVIGDFSQLSHSFATVFDNNRQIRDNASPELMRLRSRIVELERQTKRYVNNVLQNKEYQKYFQDALVTVRNNRYVIPIKQEYRHAFPGIVHDTSASGSTLYVEPLAIVNANNDLQAARIGETKEIERIFRRLTAKVQQQYNDLYDSTKCVGQLEFAFAKAQLALKMKACRPAVSKTREIKLIQARHPLIDAKHVVPNTIVIGGDYRILLITGSNTGGKTVSMKTLGLLVLMAQAGLFLPVENGSQIAVYNNIYADIGDEQSIEQSLSTFSAHMTHLVEILGKVESDDLLLLDELGAGTDPEEGAALAMAILEQLLNIKATVMATTHYSELKTFAFSRDGIENACVEFDVNTLRPTYRLLTGIPGASNAFAISRRLGLSEALVIRAKQLIQADHAQFEKVINQLEKEKMMYEQ
uniref:endonuclease MutS2 n=1 Tax=uncultured Megasphaera sp. TaxID=165188 RepID=UPI0025866DA2